MRHLMLNLQVMLMWGVRCEVKCSSQHTGIRPTELVGYVEIEREESQTQILKMEINLHLYL